MERENQIEIANEIYKTLFWEADCSLSDIDCTIIADLLVSKGYGLSTEVAEELINVVLSKIQIMISAIKENEESGNITEFNGGAKCALEIVFKDIDELKKKYEVKGELSNEKHKTDTM